MARVEKSAEALALQDNSLWYKDTVIYQLHVRAFSDGDGDGIGDFKGLAGKLDYLQDLGVTALWLQPFYPSPLKDDGYDISNYTSIHPNYGTLKDFKTFLREAHRRGLRVITELVLNHTSDQHPWFQQARRAKPGSKMRDFYVWSDTQEKYQEARIIFKDFELSNWTWDPIAKAYYWHRFYSHQPDLNFDNPEVREAMFKVLEFWLDAGVDGLRLDAVPYLYEREGTNCENLPETHAFLKELRRKVDKKYRDRMLLAEANQWPEDAVNYFGAGDECHMAFHFPLMPRLFMAVHMEDRFPIIEILDQTPQIAEVNQWALFLRNHDELTLEMVTDEDRDYMYQVYATDPQARINLGIRRRLAPLLGNHRRKMELLKSLLFSMPGTPVIYYGDEIGMGDNIYLGDRNGVRTPMQWSADRNAGFSRANPQRLYLPIIIDPENHYEAVNVEAQQENLHSFLWWMKRLIALRKRFQAFGKGTIEFLYPRNRKVLVFIRRFADEIILVVANLSRFVQFAELDLSSYKGSVPVELFGQTKFPSIGDLPYFITVGPHAFYWFKLEQPRGGVSQPAAIDSESPVLRVTGSWEALLSRSGKVNLERILPDYLKSCRWFGGKARQVRSAEIVEAIPMPFDSGTAYLVAVKIQYSEGHPETYLLPLAFAPANQMMALRQSNPNALVTQLLMKDKGQYTKGALYDALYDNGFCRSLLDAMSRRRHFNGESAEIAAMQSKVFRNLRGSVDSPLEPSLIGREQSNTSVIYGDRLILKMFRRLQEGTNPDLEIGRFLTERVSFSHVPPLAGSLDFHKGKGEPTTIGTLHGLVSNEGDAWQYTLDSLPHYFDDALARKTDPTAAASVNEHILDLVQKDVLPFAREVIGPYLASASLLGQRSGELHVALASDTSDPNFAPEPFTALYRRSVYQSMRTFAEKTWAVLSDRLQDLPESLRSTAKELLGLKSRIFNQFRLILEHKITGMRLRVHGDYHLGQVLYTGKDFFIIDFEGEPARPISERRMKRSPLKDVAGMLRSFNYAPAVVLRNRGFRPEDMPQLELWGRFWRLWVCVAFLKSYLDVTASAGFLPRSREETKVLLDLHVLEKAIYELNYELNNRPDWVSVPIRGIMEILQRPQTNQ